MKLSPLLLSEVDVSFSAAPPKYFFSVSEKSGKKTEGETPFGKVSERECLRLPGKASLRSSGRAPGGLTGVFSRFSRISCGFSEVALSPAGGRLAPPWAR